MRNFVWDNNAWYFGANFTPSNAINQLEMWQAETFDPETIKRELGYAAKIGMNIMRVYLHDLLWEQDSKGFLNRMEQYLEISDSLGIKTMFVFFDDCWKSEFALGKQPEPVPNSHNSGWIQSPGSKAADDLSQRPRLEAYVKGVLTHFAHDKRIVLWDLYNEPGNGACGDHFSTTGLRENASMDLLQDVFRWAKDVNPDQPFTAAPWKFEKEFDDLNRFMFEHSDVVTFHAYNKPAELLERINFIRYEAKGRPMLCSEYMARHAGSSFTECLPIMKENNISAVNWGLVSGKTQTVFPWSCLMDTADLSIPFHDVFNQDGTLLVPEEAAVFSKLSASQK